MISVHHRNNQSGAIVESLTDGYGAGRVVPPAGTGAAIESRRFFSAASTRGAYRRALERGGA